MRKLVVATTLSIFSLTLSAQTIIPIPERQTASQGVFFAQNVRINIKDKALKDIAPFIDQIFTEDKRSRNTITLVIDKKIAQAESYTIDVSEREIKITGADKAGVFYAIQSLIQMAENGEVNSGRVTDAPRYAWRGFMVDESRHFFGMEKIKQTIDMMARYKLNKLHWHLTDEPAWRIEIKQYPRLASVGGSGTWSEPEAKVQFYTQDQLREIVQYAALRQIEIIPEIDMPGHATAANRAYPEYSGGGVPEHPDFTFNPGKEEVYQYLTNILREVASIFPTKYLHIGGDEVSFGIKAWESDSAVRALMDRENITTTKGVEHYFIRRMADSIAMLDKELIGWDELLDAKVEPEKTTIMWWRHDKVGALRQSLTGGYPTIMCPRRPLYFDFVQHASHKWGRVWNGFCPIEDVYNFPDKGFAEWKLSDKQNIIGIQANLWTERIQNEERFDFMVYPRLAAMAEAAWSGVARKDFGNFNRRMEREYKLYDKMELYYYKQGRPEPKGCEKPKTTTPMDFRD